MKALTLFLGARAIEIAESSQRRSRREADLPPIASTPEQRGAWARWRRPAGRRRPCRRPPFVAGQPAAHPGPG